MSCHCHTKDGIAVTQSSPLDQCSICAKKHIVKAWQLWNEFTYTDDNRDTLTGQLRLAVDHLMYEHPGTARKARDLAMRLEDARDGELSSEWHDLLDAVRADAAADHPGIARRLEQLKNETRPESRNPVKNSG